MAHPLCRQAINRRVSGSPHEWPLDWFKRVYAAAAIRARRVLGMRARGLRALGAPARRRGRDRRVRRVRSLARRRAARGGAGVHRRHPLRLRELRRSAPDPPAVRHRVFPRVAPPRVGPRAALPAAHVRPRAGRRGVRRRVRRPVPRRLDARSAGAGPVGPRHGPGRGAAQGGDRHPDRAERSVRGDSVLRDPAFPGRLLRHPGVAALRRPGRGPRVPVPRRRVGLLAGRSAVRRRDAADRGLRAGAKPGAPRTTWWRTGG